MSAGFETGLQASDSCSDVYLCPSSLLGWRWNDSQPVKIIFAWVSAINGRCSYWAETDLWLTGYNDVNSLLNCPTCLHLCSSVSLSICLSVCPSVSVCSTVSVIRLSIILSVICLSLGPFVSSFCPYLSLSLVVRFAVNYYWSCNVCTLLPATNFKTCFHPVSLSLHPSAWS